MLNKTLLFLVGIIFLIMEVVEKLSQRGEADESDLW